MLIGNRLDELPALFLADVIHHQILLLTVRPGQAAALGRGQLLQQPRFFTFAVKFPVIDHKRLIVRTDIHQMLPVIKGNILHNLIGHTGIEVQGQNRLRLPGHNRTQQPVIAHEAFISIDGVIAFTLLRGTLLHEGLIRTVERARQRPLVPRKILDRRMLDYPDGNIIVLLGDIIVFVLFDDVQINRFQILAGKI
ncbi:hypothetical protein D3C75_685150 [compost metagenome]